MPDRYQPREYRNVEEAALEQRLAPALRAVDAFVARYGTTPDVVLRDPALWNALTVQAKGIKRKDLKEAVKMARKETGTPTRVDGTKGSKTVRVNGKRHAVWFQEFDGVPHMAFAGGENWTPIPEKDSYAYDHGGAVYRAATDLWYDTHPHVDPYPGSNGCDTGAPARVPDTMRPWVGRRYTFGERGLSPVVPYAGAVFLTTLDPSEGMQPVLVTRVEIARGAPEKVSVHALSGSRQGATLDLYGATFWRPATREARQAALFRTDDPKGRQGSLFGTGATTAHGRKPTITYVYRGQIERFRGRSYKWFDGYSEQQPDGTVEYPWITKREAQAAAKARGATAKFIRDETGGEASKDTGASRLTPGPHGLWSSSEDPRIGKAALRAFRQSSEKPSGRGHRFDSFYEHGQWYISDIPTGAVWSVIDARGRGAVWVKIGSHDVSFGFEQVAEGDVYGTGAPRKRAGYPYEKPINVLERLWGTLELSREQLESLSNTMWRKDLDPTKPKDLARGLKLVGLDPDDFGIDTRDTGAGAPRKRRKTTHRPAAEVMASAADIRRAVEDATRGLPAGEYEITIH